MNVISYFAIAIMLSGIQLFIINKLFPDAMAMTEWSTKGMEEFQRKNLSVHQEYQSIMMMLYVPLYALISRIVFYDKKTFIYTEQIVIYMYIQAQMSITSAVFLTALVILGLDYGLLAMLIIPVMIGYTAFCLKRVYALSISEIFLKTIIFLILLGITLVLFTILFFGILYFIGDLEAMFGARRAASGS